MAVYLDFEQNEDGSLKEAGEVTIDNKHRVFSGTEYEDMKFLITGTPPTRSQLKAYRKDATSKKGRLDPDAYNTAIWMGHVTGWMLQGKDKKDIPFSEGNKKFLVEKLPGFTTAIAQCLIDGQVKEDIEEKNLSTSGDGE